MHLERITEQELNDLWTATAHEGLLCQESFARFEACGEKQIAAAVRGLVPSRRDNIAAYGAYAEFLRHLCEVYKALIKIEKHLGRIPMDGQFDPWLRVETARLMKGRLLDIKNGIAPSWENAASIYEMAVPENFPEDLREVRNRTDHVGHERANPAAANQPTLKEFYQRYHVPFVHVLFRQIRSGYLEQNTRTANWDAIEGFTVLAGALVTDELRQLFMLSDGKVTEQYALLFCDRENLGRWIENGLITRNPAGPSYELTEKGRRSLENRR